MLKRVLETRRIYLERRNIFTWSSQAMATMRMPHIAADALPEGVGYTEREPPLDVGDGLVRPGCCIRVCPVSRNRDQADIALSLAVRRLRAGQACIFLSRAAGIFLASCRGAAALGMLGWRVSRRTHPWRLSWAGAKCLRRHLKRMSASVGVARQLGRPRASPQQEDNKSKPGKPVSSQSIFSNDVISSP